MAVHDRQSSAKPGDLARLVAPAYRGFAPTVAALLDGASSIGVTALLPGVDIDSGDILAQHGVPISAPTSIGEAFELLRPAYRSCIESVVEQFAHSGLPLEGSEQSEDDATYSQWRDESDFFVDWSDSAAVISRAVLALGPPYSGAQTYTTAGDRLALVTAEGCEDRNIVQRTPGKLFAVDDEGFIVVCGSGMLRVSEFKPLNGVTMPRLRLRTRLADAAESRLLLRAESQRDTDNHA